MRHGKDGRHLQDGHHLGNMDNAQGQIHRFVPTIGRVRNLWSMQFEESNTYERTAADYPRPTYNPDWSGYAWIPFA
ncbi:hypothetical protein DRQ33_04390 [bacterium]|nr:MAG: hypothetical protein DRQ33_04390 [bacterium]